MAYVLLENRKTLCEQANSHYFHGSYTRICCTTFDTLQSSLDKVDEARRSGKYLVGYIAYEASYGLNEKIVSGYQYTSHRPLLDFYCFEYHELLTQEEVACLLEKLTAKDECQTSFIYNAKLSFNTEQYISCLDKIKTYIIEGETYQVNFTGKYRFRLHGSALDLYIKLRERQKVEFAALFFGENFQLLSLSPELFFEKKSDHLRSKPMKGTMPRAHDKNQDMENKVRLVTDPKIIAEHMIVVDLIRNDLSMIAQEKTVQALHLFEIETYETVYQMTSTITCNIDKDLAFSHIISSLFPCGSITGAPKIKTMQIIRELEQQDRSIYTGAIGFITPDNDMCFNVAIRTLYIEDNAGECGVGGGIVHDSIIQEELEEVKTKANFFMDLATPFNLIECFLYDAKIGFRYLDAHLQRLFRSAEFFNFRYFEQAICDDLVLLTKTLDARYPYKIKLVLQKHGAYNITSFKLEQQNLKNKVQIYDDKISTYDNILFNHKTDVASIRGYYNRVLKQKNAYDNLFDIIFVNKDGYVTEGSKSNVFMLKGELLLTPALDCGVLPGIMREKFLEMYPQTKEAYITTEDLMKADKIWMTNSIVGIVAVSLIHG